MLSVIRPMRIIEAVAKRIGVPMEKGAGEHQRYSNTGAACMPLVLLGLRIETEKKGDRIIFTAFRRQWCLLLQVGV